MSKQVPYINYGDYYRGDFTDPEQIAAEYARVGRIGAQKINADDYLSNDKDMWGNIASYGSTGLSIGMATGNPYVAIGTTLAGAGIGYIDYLNSKERIKNQIADNNFARQQYVKDAYERIGYSADILQDKLYRQSEAHAVAEGGPIERKQMSLKDFETMVSKRKPEGYSENNRVVRTYCKGGVKISFK